MKDPCLRPGELLPVWGDNTLWRTKSLIQYKAVSVHLFLTFDITIWCETILFQKICPPFLWVNKSLEGHQWYMRRFIRNTVLFLTFCKSWILTYFFLENVTAFCTLPWRSTVLHLIVKYYFTPEVVTCSTGWKDPWYVICYICKALLDVKATK